MALLGGMQANLNCFINLLYFFRFKKMLEFNSFEISISVSWAH